MNVKGASIKISDYYEQDEQMVAQRAENGVRLFAEIREDSKYVGQTKAGQHFPVFISNRGEYLVQGGPGGQYRLRDVNLFVEVQGVHVQISNI